HVWMFFFFFQAEDGIRDKLVTGVQTCALPISVRPAQGGEERIPIHGLRKRIFEKMAKSNVTAAHFTYVEEVDMSQLVHLRDHLRSEERRVGKECRSRWSRDHDRKIWGIANVHA